MKRYAYVICAVRPGQVESLPTVFHRPGSPCTRPNLLDEVLAAQPGVPWTDVDGDTSVVVMANNAYSAKLQALEYMHANERLRGSLALANFAGGGGRMFKKRISPPGVKQYRMRLSMGQVRHYCRRVHAERNGLRPLLGYPPDSYACVIVLYADSKRDAWAKGRLMYEQYAAPILAGKRVAIGGQLADAVSSLGEGENDDDAIP